MGIWSTPTARCTVYGGTSVSAQVFAGIAALMNQYLVSSGKQAAPGLGNINPQLYSLAQTSSGVFHDITTGNNIVTVPCSSRRGCSDPTVGYNAGVGYDLVTGLGSVDVWNLITGWGSGGIVTPPPPTVSLSLISNLSSMDTRDVTFLVATATSTNGVTPVGTVVFTAGLTALGSATLVGSNGFATATLAANGGEIGLGCQPCSQIVTATYNGSSSTVTASVNLSGQATSASNGTPSIKSVNNAAIPYTQIYAPGMTVAVFGSQLAPSGTGLSSIAPLALTMAGVAATVNGEAAPLLYVSPNQVNVQIPYEIPVGSPATLEIDNNGQITSISFFVAATAPGIFVDTSGNIVNGNLPAIPGQPTALYLTGAGAVSPPVATGAAPTPGTIPTPVQTVSVTVNGVQVPTPLYYNGISGNLVGVVQVNFEVPPGTPLGRQPVVVTIGSASSGAAYLNVTAQ